MESGWYPEKVRLMLATQLLWLKSPTQWWYTERLNGAVIQINLIYSLQTMVTTQLKYCWARPAELWWKTADVLCCWAHSAELDQLSSSGKLLINGGYTAEPSYSAKIKLDL